MKRRAIQLQSMNEVGAYVSRLMSVAGMRGVFWALRLMCVDGFTLISCKQLLV